MSAVSDPTSLQRFSMLIGGEAVEAASGERYESDNPYLGAPWASVPDAAPADVDRAVAAARGALDGEWGSMTGFQRAALLRRFAS
jgi:aldehyde dehydrogenase (NAD+)